MDVVRVAVIHDILTVYGGGERVLEAILQIYPQADLYTSVYNLTKFPRDSQIVQKIIQKDRFSGGGDPERAVGETPWQGRLFGFSWPSIGGGVVKFFSLWYPLVFEHLNLADYDLVISSSSNFAKGVITSSNTLHISYVHTPPRFLYHYTTESNWRGSPLLGGILRPIDSALRVWDYQAAQRPDYLITNSRNTAQRVRKYYRREAHVIYPPVEMVEKVGDRVSPGGVLGTDPIGLTADGRGPARNKPGHWLQTAGESPPQAEQGYFLLVSRLSKYKNVDLVIEAFSRLPGRQLKIVGIGPEMKKLKIKAQKLNLADRIKFLGFLTDEELVKYYASARALIAPTQEEDFGITLVEAMACGTPVVALRSGGYQETVIEGQTGVFFDEPTPESLVEVLQGFNPNAFDSPTIRQHARKFSKSRFQQEFRKFVGSIAKIRATWPAGSGH